MLFNNHGGYCHGVLYHLLFSNSEVYSFLLVWWLFNFLSFLSLPGIAVLYSWHQQPIFDLHIVPYSFLSVFLPAPHFLPATILIIYSALFGLALVLSICSSQFDFPGFLWFLLVMYNAKLSVNSNSSTPFLNFFKMSFIATRKNHT